MKIVYIILAAIVLLVGANFVLNTDKTVNADNQIKLNSLNREKVTEENSDNNLSKNSFEVDTDNKDEDVENASVKTLKVENTAIKKSSAAIVEKGILRVLKNASELDTISGTNILFFKATWCSTCTALYDALAKEKDSIPSGVTIWVVDYDSNQKLRREYGVTSQHTLVQIDTSKKKVNLWRGGFSLADVMSNVK